MIIRLTSCIWLLIVFVLVEAGKKRKKRPGADYYAILDVPEDADKDAIKKAYRAKSLEYHPDKCEDEKEKCQTKFIEVSTAYEVLSDPEKRSTYNEHGEEGLKEGGAGGQTGEQARQMFRQFFGREPDGNVRIVNRGGQMMFHEEGEPGPKEDIYGGDTSVTELNGDVWKAYINERDEPWVVMFYKPNDDDSVEVKPEFLKFGDTFKDFLKVAAVNCRQQRDICSGASINNFPAVRWFTENKTDAPEVFEGSVTAKVLGKWATSMMPDYAKPVADKRELRAWLDNAKGPTVLLFSDKKETPPMWKALSREFKGRAELGVVLRCDKSGVFKTPLQKEFDVYIPQIIRIDPIDELGKIAEKFDSQIKKDVLSLWLMKTIALGKRAGPAATFKEWSTARFEAGDCAPTDGQFCFLWLKAGADAKVEEATRQLAHKYRTDPVKMMWANVELNPSLLEAFGLENSDATDFFVAFRPKRSKFKVHEGPLLFPELDAFVDGVMNGGPLTEKLKVPKIEL